MAEGSLSIKIRCASWQQLATIYKRDLSHGTMFLKAAAPPAIGTPVRIDLALPSATVIVLTGVVQRHIQDPQRGTGVELTLAPIPASSVWLIESALASEYKRLATPGHGAAIPGTRQTGQVPAIPAVPGTRQTGQVPAIPAVPGTRQTGQVPAIPAVPAISDSADVSAAEQALIKALVSEAEALKKLSPFLVLGVGYEATDAEVRAAFGELTKRYHPDRFARYESPELRLVAEEIFILIRDAYRRLGDPMARAQVLQSLGKSAPPPRAIAVPPRATPPAAPPRTPHVPGLQPSPAALPASAALAVSATPASSAALQPTAEQRGLAPRRATLDTASPSTPAAWRPRPNQASPIGEPLDVSPLEHLIDQGRLDDALAGYRAMGKKHPHDRNLRAGVELCEGLLALAARDRNEAAQRFEAALEIDPSNERAARGLADMRRQATNERKGLLSRLMGKEP